MQQRSIKNQQGATLLVAMVILILVSLIGVTALKNASVEEQMAANLYMMNLTFQASESAVESTINDKDLLRDTLSNDPPQSKNVAVDLPDTTAQVSYKSNGLSDCTPGNSCGVFAGARIMITATGLSTDSSTRTRTVHGVVVTVPGL